MVKTKGQGATLLRMLKIRAQYENIMYLWTQYFMINNFSYSKTVISTSCLVALNTYKLAYTPLGLYGSDKRSRGHVGKNAENCA